MVGRIIIAFRSLSIETIQLSRCWSGCKNAFENNINSLIYIQRLVAKLGVKILLMGCPRERERDHASQSAFQLGISIYQAAQMHYLNALVWEERYKYLNNRRVQYNRLTIKYDMSIKYQLNYSLLLKYRAYQ